MSPFFGNLWWLWGVLMRGVGQIYYFSFLGRAANVSRWNIRPCCLGAGVGRADCQVKGRNTEVGARMPATSVNREQLQDKQAQGIPKWGQECRLLR